MRPTSLTHYAFRTSGRGWRELATSENDRLTVSLLWSKATNAVKVAVVDTKLDHEFEFDVAGADALAAFYHPFAYAAGSGVQGEAIDLQLQS
jgi:hypothetical protein